MKKNINNLQLAICILLAILIVAVVGDILVVKLQSNGTETQVEESKRADSEDKKEAKEAKTDDNSSDKEESSSEKSANEVSEEYFYADVYDDKCLILKEDSPNSDKMLYLEPYTQMVILSEESYPMVKVKTIDHRFAGSVGFVDKNYLTKKGEAPKRVSTTYNCYTVVGTKEYLPLRDVGTYEDKYEIGRLYNGDQVALIDRSSSDFWYVRDIKTGKTGFVSSRYLTKL